MDTTNNPTDGYFDQHNALDRFIDAVNALIWMEHYATRRSIRAWTIYTTICGVTRSLN